MVYRRGLFVGFAAVLLIFFTSIGSVSSGKVVYKKAIFGHKTNAIKEKRVILKTTTSTTTTTTTTRTPTTLSEDFSTIQEEDVSSQKPNAEIKSKQQETTNATRAENSDQDTSTPTTRTATYTTTTTERNLPIPCRCGVFLTSQFKRGSNQQPKGHPVVVTELNKVFPCNGLGQKQCQTKCLESIVTHLPNSAKILCATLDRDCHKERAYLFIQNCEAKWINTNLAAGREYCCKNGVSHPCPFV